MSCTDAFRLLTWPVVLSSRAQVTATLYSSPLRFHSVYDTIINQYFVLYTLEWTTATVVH